MDQAAQVAEHTSRPPPHDPPRTPRGFFPEHYTIGSATLRITDPIDKARFGRELPLSVKARAALDAVLPERGLVFGRHDYRDQLKKAACAMLDEHKAETFAPYDLRHARLTQLAESGNLPGAALLAGHKRATTTAGYIRANRRARFGARRGNRLHCSDAQPR